ncbi:uncharacterized protein LOC144432766 [Glandiceps talaboti]
MAEPFARSFPSNWEEFKKEPFKNVQIQFKMKMGIRISTQHPVTGGWEALAESLGFDNDDIARIRLEGQKPDKYVGCILLDEFGHRGRSSTVQVLEEQLKDFGREDVLNILYASAQLVCQLTCTVKLNGGLSVELSQCRVPEGKTLLEALEADLEMNHLVLDELEFEQIPTLMERITWNTKVGKLKGRHLILLQRKPNKSKTDAEKATSMNLTPKVQDSMTRKPTFDKAVHPEGEFSGFNALSVEDGCNESSSDHDTTDQPFLLRRSDRFPSVTVKTLIQHRGDSEKMRRVCSYPSTNVQYEPDGHSSTKNYPQSPSHSSPPLPSRPPPPPPPPPRSPSSSPSSSTTSMTQVTTVNGANSDRACLQLAKSVPNSSECSDQFRLPHPHAQLHLESISHKKSTEPVISTHPEGAAVILASNELQGTRDADLVEASKEAGWHPYLRNDSNEIHRVMKHYLKCDGCYIIRPLEDGKLAISVTYMGQKKHFRLHRKIEGWFLFKKGPKMQSLRELIEWYQTNGIPIQNGDGQAQQCDTLLKLRYPITAEHMGGHVFF